MSFPPSLFADETDDDPASPPLVPRTAPVAAPTAAPALSLFAPDPSDTLTDAMQRATATKPDTAARIFGLQLKTGLPSDVIARNLDQVEKDSAAADFDPVAFRKNSPALASWLEQHPLNASLVRDDLVPMTGMERTLGFARRLFGDTALTAIKGAIAVPEMAVGLADIAQTLRPGAILDRALGIPAGELPGAALERVGFQPALAKSILGSFYSKAQAGAFQSVQEADGAIATAVAALSHPSVILHNVLESAPMMLAGGAMGRALPFLSPVVAGAIGEGATQAGSAAEQSRQTTGTLTPTQALLATSSGVVTGAIGVFGGKLAQRLGIGDVDTLLAGAAVSTTARRGLATQILLGAVEEGFLEELPQSISEQVHQNLADGRPIGEGVANAAVMGALAGAVMGGGANVFGRLGKHAAESKTIQRSPEAAEAVIADATKGAADTVYAPLDTWNEYWQSKGVDPAAKAAEVTGSAEAYTFATQSGGELPIPTARYVTQIASTEHNAYFANELRLDPEQMNGRELEALSKSLETSSLATEQEPVAVSPLRTAVESRLVAAGVPASQATAYAELADVVSNLSERSGIDLQATHQYGLDVVRPDLSVLQAPVSPSVLTETGKNVPETLRTMDPALAGPSAALPEGGLVSETTPPTSPQAAAEAIAAPVEGEATPVYATFLGHGPSGPLYNLVGGPADRSTVSAAELTAQGIPIPETPEEGAQLTGEQLRAQAMQTRAAVRLDTAAQTAESETPDGAPESETRGGVDQPRLPARLRIAPSYPRERESPTQRTRREAEHVQGVFTALLESAQTLDPTVDPVDLRAEFDFRLDAWKGLRETYQDSGHDPRDLLRAIADNGGLAEESASGWRGELADLKSGAKFGAVAGVGKVFRAAVTKDGAGRPITGLPFDVMQQRLQQDPRFAWIENVNILFDALDEIIRNPPALEGLPGTDELRADVGIDERTAWWRDSWRPVDFDVSEFHQGPKDQAGEAQPVLPGTEGVREQEIATPEFALPFALTSETGTPKKHQSKVGRLFDELFQALYHGSPHDFDKFSSTKIGTGEGAQAFGHGLYFAESKDVAEGYQRDLAFAGTVTIDGQPWRDAKLTKIQREMLATVEAQGIHLNRPDTLASLGDAFRAIRSSSPANQKLWGRWAEQWNDLADRLEQAEPKATLYQVDIPEEHVAKMLDWDKPLSEQSTSVREALDDLGVHQPEIRHQGGTYYVIYIDGKALGSSNTREQAVLNAQTMMTGAAIYERLADAADADDRGSMPYAERRAQASRTLRAAGIPGIRYLDAGSRNGAQEAGTHNVVVFDDAIITLTHKDGTAVTSDERKEFLQTAVAEPPTSGAPERRGSIRFGADHQFTISLLEKADPSTFLHEMGHFFLEVFGDASDALSTVDPSTLTDAQRKVLADYGATLQRFGVESRDAITREHHEQFAREFEGYLFEGTAPSVALRSTFSRFRAWLIGVYGSLKKLNVQLTPEVRGIFDRLIASDQAIAEAEAARGPVALFTTAESAGMTPPEFAAYTKTIEAAHRTAREKLDQQLLAEVRREQTANWQTQRAAIQAIVTDETHAQPVYQALAAMQKGTTPGGESLQPGAPAPLKLDKDLIVARYGKDRLKTLPRPYVYTTTDGVDPNLVAEFYGFSSGDELLTAITQAPPMQTAIGQETTRRMLEQHGSLLLDGTIGEAAQAAVAEADHDAIREAEERALRKLQRTVAPHVGVERAKARGGAVTIREGVPTAKVFREAAQVRIDGTVVRAIRPQVFASAARQAGVRAIETAARQEFDAAILATRQARFNDALFTAATRAKQDVADRAAWVEAHNTPAARSRLGLAGGSYLDQWDGVLDRYSFAKASPKVLDRLVSMRKWVEGLESQGLPVDLPEALLDDTRHVHYQELTVEAFVGVTDGLKALVHLAQLKNKLLKSVDQRDFAVVRDGIVASIRDHHAVHAVPLEFRPGDEKWRKVSRWFAAHTKIAILARALDGHVDGGAMWEAFIRPINAAADAEVTRKEQAGAAYTTILETAYPGRELGTLNEKLFIPAIQTSLSKEGRLAIALNWGNQTSRDRILADPALKVNAAQVQAILDTLDKRDWTFVQATWDYLNGFWPEIAEQQRRLTGLAPEKVDALPVTTKFGDLPGGYYPLAYDARKAAKAGQHQAATDAKLATSAAYVRTTTKHGHLEARVSNVTLPVQLDLGVAFRHLDSVIHDLTHREMLIDTTRLLRDPTVAKALYETKVLGASGDILYKQVEGMLQDLALGSSAGAGQPGVLDTAATFLRTRTQIAGMGWNLWTALQQPLGLFNGASRVGPVWVARGMKRWLRDAGSMQSTATWIAEVSPMMRARVMTATQDLSDLRQSLRQPGGWFDQTVRTVSGDRLTQQTILDGYLWHIGIAQRVADIPTWLGGYEKAMAAGNDEARSIALADQGVLDSQGGGQIKDLAQVQRGSAVAKLFMTFYSYGNTVYNATAERASATDFSKPSEVLTFLGHLSLLTILPALATESLRCATRSTCEEWPAFVQSVGGQILGDVMNMQVGLRELAGAAKIVTGSEAGSRGYEGPAALRPITLVTQLAQQIQQGEADAALAKASNAVAGLLFRYPTAQVQRSVEGFVALQHGETKNPLALLFGPPKKAK